MKTRFFCFNLAEEHYCNMSDGFGRARNHVVKLQWTGNVRCAEERTIASLNGQPSPVALVELLTEEYPRGNSHLI